MTWSCKHFDELSTQELYDLLRLRSEVFVVEQDCVYLDLDGKDQKAWHLFATENDKIVACVRILATGASYPDAASIGRVCSHLSVRKRAIGQDLMQRSIAKARALFPGEPIRIGAQLYLLKFYNTLGFAQSSEEYLEDGIPHIEMLLPA